MTEATAMPATPEATLDACATALRAGDEEAADRHWREFVRLLWQPMSARVPWIKRTEGNP